MGTNNKKEEKKKIALPQQIDKQGWLFIKFQEGSVKKWKKNGISEVDLLNVVKKRLAAIQTYASSRARSIAITKVEEALLWLNTIEEVDL